MTISFFFLSGAALKTLEEVASYFGAACPKPPRLSRLLLLKCLPTLLLGGGVLRNVIPTGVTFSLTFLSSLSDPAALLWVTLSATNPPLRSRVMMKTDRLMKTEKMGLPCALRTSELVGERQGAEPH